MHTRYPNTTLTYSKNLKIDPNFRYDSRLQEIYRKLYKGEIKISLTRLRGDSIYIGHFIRKESGKVEHVSNLNEDFIDIVCDMIRSGHRPIIDVYWNVHAPNGGGYVCADDEVVLAAYNRLKILFVPCRVMRPIHNKHDEAAILLEKQGEYPSIHKALPANADGYATFMGDRDINIVEFLESLIERCETTRREIVEFHINKQRDVNYHEMLCAAMYKHQIALDSVKSLVKAQRHEHAQAIVRMCYEAFLNFYIDWLSPHFFGPRLQLLSALRNREIAGKCKNEKAWASLTNFPKFLENTSEKARISPLGVMYHDMTYPLLSLVAHQSYGGLENLASKLNKQGEVDNAFEEKQITRWLDLLTAAFIVRVDNEIGRGTMLR